MQCSSKESLVRLSVNLDPKCFRESLLLPRTDLPCCLATLSHWLGAAFGNLGNKAIDFRVVSWSSWPVAFPGVTYLRGTFSWLPSSILWVTHTYFSTQVWETISSLFPWAGSSWKDSQRRKGSMWLTTVPIAAVFRAAADTHLALSVSQGDHRCGCNAAITVLCLHPHA